MPVVLVLFAVLFLAYANGANDNFKGVATLYGGGTAGYRTSLIWATITTAAGSLPALVLAEGLVVAFSGRGLVPDALLAGPEFLTSAALGAAATVMTATLAGLPISTTHALVGGLLGAGLAAAGAELNWPLLGGVFLVPLLAGPVIAMIAAVVIYPAFRSARRRLGVTPTTCVCVGAGFEEAVVRADGTAVLRAAGTSTVRVWTAADCVERYDGRVAGVSAGAALDVLHYLSAGAVGFARGLNDTPKIVALLIAAEATAPEPGLVLVALFMAVGGVLNAARVAETMSKRITRLNPGRGFTANLVTSVLVALAARFGLPVATTHVAVGAIFGIGLVNGTARRDIVLTILSAWLITLPTAAAAGAAAYALLR